MNGGEALQMREARLSICLSSILYTLQPRVHKLSQSILGVELWRQMSSQHTYHTLNFLGISQCAKAARAHVDKLCQEFDTKAASARREAQETLQQVMGHVSVTHFTITRDPIIYIRVFTIVHNVRLKCE